MHLQKNIFIIHLNAISYRVPLPITQVIKSYDGFFDSLCPRCRGILPYEYIRYCPLCGQRLYWRFLDDAEELHYIERKHEPQRKTQVIWFGLQLFLKRVGQSWR